MATRHNARNAVAVAYGLKNKNACPLKDHEVNLCEKKIKMSFTIIHEGSPPLSVLVCYLQTTPSSFSIHSAPATVASSTPCTTHSSPTPPSPWNTDSPDGYASVQVSGQCLLRVRVSNQLQLAQTTPSFHPLILIHLSSYHPYLTFSPACVCYNKCIKYNYQHEVENSILVPTAILQCLVTDSKCSVKVSDTATESEYPPQVEF